MSVVCNIRVVIFVFKKLVKTFNVSCLLDTKHKRFVRCFYGLILCVCVLLIMHVIEMVRPINARTQSGQSELLICLK